MTERPSPATKDEPGTHDFAQQASERPQNPFWELLVDFVRFLGEEKKWWLIPILVALAVIGALAMLLNSPAAPFIYPLF